MLPASAKASPFDSGKDPKLFGDTVEKRSPQCETPSFSAMAVLELARNFEHMPKADAKRQRISCMLCNTRGIHAAMLEPAQTDCNLILSFNRRTNVLLRGITFHD